MRGRTRTVVAVVLVLSPLLALAACSSSDGDSTAKSSTTTSTTEQGENEKGQKGSTMDLTANPWGLVSFTAPAETQGRNAVLQFAEDGSIYVALTEAEAQALAVQDEIIALRRARGERTVGYKIGFTNRTIWPVYGVHQPIWAATR